MSESKTHSGNLSAGFMKIENIPVFFAAPHRVMFFAGSLQLVLVLLFWLIELAGRYTSLWDPFYLSVNSTWMHVFLMDYGLYPFFIFGFLMTTYPKWLKTDPISPLYYLPSFILMSLGMLLFYISVIGKMKMLEAAISIYLAGWLFGLFALVNIYIHSNIKRSRYEHILSVAVIMGFFCGLSGLLWLFTSRDILLQLNIVGGFWLFLLPVLVTVSHRMIPFFSSLVIDNYQIRRPAWSLPVMLSCLTCHAILVLVAVPQWTFIFDFILAFTAVYLSYLWGLRKSFKAPLLAMLHVAFLWLFAGMIMYAVQSVTLLISNEYILGKAPVHAVGIGFITSMVLAMATRVTLGHSGRNLIAPGIIIICFWLLQLICISRIFGDLTYTFFFNSNYYWILLAGILWLLCFILWTSRILPIYLQPRIDGKSG
jgi:uncharacterized protein involved in response to NO